MTVRIFQIISDQFQINPVKSLKLNVKNFNFYCICFSFSWYYYQNYLPYYFQL